MVISMIAAMGSNRVIGKDNDLPWHLPDDFRFFKETTRGHHVVMGRKNWESLPPKFQPLPDRPNLIITRQQGFLAEGATVFNTVPDAVEYARSREESEVFIIGGGEIYRLGLPLASKIYLTEIDQAFEGQTTFPEFDQSEWVEATRVHHPIDEKHKYAFDFVTYEKQ